MTALHDPVLAWNVGLFTPYSLLVAGGVVASAILWARLIRGRGNDRRLPVIYACGLAGAIIGAKLAFLLAEGWHFRHDTTALITGKSITGALLLGYAGVEVGKKLLRYTSPTGDLFAIVVPLSIALGRVGCILQGCCPGAACTPAWYTIADHAGTPRWPAAHAELAFNLLFALWALAARRLAWCTGNHFHVYLMAYGLFRFAHEFARDDARLWGPFSGYHALAAAMAIFGAYRFITRRHR